jgi:hypothetical protein
MTEDFGSIEDFGEASAQTEDFGEDSTKSRWENLSVKSLTDLYKNNLLETEAVANLIAGAPGEIILAGAKAVSDVGNIIKGSDTPALDTERAAEDFKKTEAGKFLLNPVSTLIGNQDEVDTTVTSKAINTIGETAVGAISAGAEQLGLGDGEEGLSNTEQGLVHLGELGLSLVGAKIGGKQIDDIVSSRSVADPLDLGYDEFGNIKKVTEDPQSLKRALDKGLGTLSTRIANISEPFVHKAIGYEKDLLVNTHKKIESVDPFLKSLNSLDKNTQSALDSALLNNNFADVRDILTKTDKKLLPEFDNVITTLRETGNELADSGRLSSLLVDYFPRVVRDVDGLLNTLGTSKKQLVEKRLLEAEQKAGFLTELEKTDIINKVIRGYTNTEYKPGFTKERKLERLTAEQEKFYAPPTESLHSYLRNAVSDVETRKFFGRNFVKDPETGRINLDESIGKTVLDELNTGKISGEDVSNLTDMLKSRFGAGNRSSNPVIQGAKDIANLGLLGNVISTITQLSDIAIPIYVNGLKPTIMAMTKNAIGGNKLDIKDFGLVDNISQEFVGTTKTSKALNTAFKLTGFSKIDALGKNVMLNSSVTKAQNMAKTPAGVKELSKTWGNRFGNEFPQLINDLQTGVRSELTDMLAFSSLSKVQPITKLELPQKYLDMPNGRMVYMLKTYALKQMDLVRNDIIKEIASGNRKKGIANAARYAMILGTAGATTQYVKDIMLGKDPETPDISDVPLNVLKTFGWSQYVTDKASQGKIGEAIGDVVLPPYQMFDEAISDVLAEDKFGNDTTKGKWKKLIPGFGKLLYANSYAGQEEQEEKTRKQQLTALKEQYGL